MLTCEITERIGRKRHFKAYVVQEASLKAHVNIDVKTKYVVLTELSNEVVWLS